MRVRILIGLSAMSSPSCMSDTDIALVLALNTLCKFLQAISSVSVFLSVFCDNNIMSATLKRCHTARVITFDTQLTEASNTNVLYNSTFFGLLISNEPENTLALRCILFYHHLMIAEATT